MHRPHSRRRGWASHVSAGVRLTLGRVGRMGGPSAAVGDGERQDAGAVPLRRWVAGSAGRGPGCPTCGRPAASGRGRPRSARPGRPRRASSEARAAGPPPRSRRQLVRADQDGTARSAATTASGSPAAIRGTGAARPGTGRGRAGHRAGGHRLRDGTARHAAAARAPPPPGGHPGARHEGAPGHPLTRASPRRRSDMTAHYGASLWPGRVGLGNGLPAGSKAS